jgi:hypothetical protein
VLYSFERALKKHNSSRIRAVEAMEKSLNELLPGDIPSYVIHKITKKRLVLLRVEFQEFIRNLDMKNCHVRMNCCDGHVEF